ncbi:prolipoprotein diacylglyceryl transferase [Actinoallomurus purpureus]|uniref:prolipoprotein diacylglyceryl transferase n=1 Tax=Actinoallomurus purpureus TaxID=478114 RepID=UPI002092BB64|nr:prolipoprotein diacylglyceryl transferase [Actinoallomurus purpureus]MCO6005915.1 prolipoprotein diacylglyceryl transferase [Actinoallomurus purpureus]
MQQPLAFIPSPSQGSIHLGPLPLRGYALMIIIGVIVAVWLGERRWVARGGASGTVVDIAVWAVPFGLVGGRLYHVITDHQLYFGHGRHPIDALKVWNGGLGIWGAIALGAFGAYLGCRRRGIALRVFADAAAPGIALAQAIGRWGNWFNQELYGRPTKLPWAVKIDAAHRPANTPDIATYQPTFLYESLWCIGVAVLVIWAEKRFRLAYGRTFALYVAAYTVGRAWIEWLRVDPAHHVLGLRLNDWTSLVVFIGAVAYLYLYRAKTEIPPGALGTASDATEEPAAPVQDDDDAATATPVEADDGTAAESAEPDGEPADPKDDEPADPKDDEPADPEDGESAQPEDESAPASDGAESAAEAENAEPADGDRTEATPAVATDEPAPESGDSKAPEPEHSTTPEDTETPEGKASDADDAERPNVNGAAPEAPGDEAASDATGTATSEKTDPETSDAYAPDGDRSRPAKGAAAEHPSNNGESDAPADSTDRPSAARGA